MADLDISIETLPVDESDDYPTEVAYIVGHYIQCIMTLITFVYGVTSWYLFRKFRTFNNYVYLSIIIVNVFRLIVGTVTLFRTGLFIAKLVQYINLYFFVFMFLSAVHNYWLVVMCYMYYVDIVTIFKNEIKRKYLKSFLFAWGIPFILLIICVLTYVCIDLADDSDKETLVSKFVHVSVIICCNVLPAIMNLILYIGLVCSLFPCNGTVNAIIPKKERRRENLSRLSIATTMFLLSNIFVLMMFLWDLYNASNIVRTVSFCLQIAVLSLFIPLVKNNRVLWCEYYKNRLKRTLF